MPDSRVFTGDFTRKEFRERLKDGTIQAAIVPTAATEQHEEHLHMIHDTLHVTYMAEQAALRLHPGVVVATPIGIGVSEHWMEHPGTLTVRPEIFCEYVFDVCHSLARAGIENILILNGHGGNVKPLMRRIDEYRDKLGINLRFQSYWDVYDPALVFEVMAGKRLPGHADEFETSTMYVLAPERIHVGDIDNPSAALATREKGQKLIEPAVAGVAGILRKMIAGEAIDCPPVTFRPEGRLHMVTGKPV
ncbi:MAG: creatininase family protein [bacterium]|nr:creatininase family protein [bacterium]